MIEGYWTNGEAIGFGEAAAIALAIKHFGIVASNNLSDVEYLTKLEDIPVLTFSMIMAFCFELNLLSKDEIESIWKKFLQTQIKHYLVRHLRSIMGNCSRMMLLDY